MQYSFYAKQKKFTWGGCQSNTERQLGVMWPKQNKKQYPILRQHMTGLFLQAVVYLLYFLSLFLFEQF